MATAFETYFRSLRGKRIAVFGMGVSNRPLVRLLLEFGCDVLGCDRTPREKLEEEVLELERSGCKLSVGEAYLEGLEADIVFRTPGMHPGNPALEALRAKGAEVTSEMEVLDFLVVVLMTLPVIHRLPLIDTLPRFRGVNYLISLPTHSVE